MSFQSFHFQPFMEQAIKSLGFTVPTPIQEQIIPLIQNNRSVIGKSATGTGKTHAFLLPLLNDIDLAQGVQKVIITPTRELAYQIFQEANKIIAFRPEITVKLYVGGTNREAELKQLETSQPHIVIGTIGKLIDLAVKSNLLKIHTAESVVIDEADMIFEENQLEEIDELFAKFSLQTQMLSFSATIPVNLTAFLNKYLQSAVFVDLVQKTISKSTIEHIFIPTKNKNKEQLLLQLLQLFQPYLVIIFANTKNRVDDLAIFLKDNGIAVEKISGDMDARERKQILKRIREGRVQFVVATDLAARGLDVEGISHIINYELPNDIEYYIHRTGRTARMIQNGQSLSFYDFEDDQYLNKLEEKGIHCQYKAIKNGVLVATRERNYRIKSDKQTKIEEELHIKNPLPKKVKPGYRKKRMKVINKELSKIKRKRIDEFFHQQNHRK